MVNGENKSGRLRTLTWRILHEGTLRPRSGFVSGAGETGCMKAGGDWKRIYEADDEIGWLADNRLWSPKGDWSPVTLKRDERL